LVCDSFENGARSYTYGHVNYLGGETKQFQGLSDAQILGNLQKDKRPAIFLDVGIGLCTCLSTETVDGSDVARHSDVLLTQFRMGF
jgi:hypothetical protein